MSSSADRALLSRGGCAGELPAPAAGDLALLTPVPLGACQDGESFIPFLGS